MADVYETRGGELIDELTFRHYGDHAGTAEAILAANPGLAARPVALPPGVRIVLPARAPTPTTKAVRLYD
ncbi:MAG: tail protein X [Paracoccaceae bacterium]